MSRFSSLLLVLIVCAEMACTSTDTQSASLSERSYSPSDPAVELKEPPPVASRKSVREWTACDGSSDDSKGFASAIAAARHKAFILIVDCKLRLRMGRDISKSIFIDNGTFVQFTGAGQIIVDNIFHPAFVMANSKDVSLVDWNVVYDGGLPTDWDVGGYERDGQTVRAAGYAQPASAFNDRILTPWLSVNRGIVFSQAEGHITSMWVGPTNTSSLFFICGDSSAIRVSGMRMRVPAEAGGDRFIPMAFSFSANFKSDQTVSVKTPRSSKFVAIPHDLDFSNIELDGTYMGWQGNVRDAVFESIRSHRYGDLQDAQGGQVGGLNKWFAPPHLFYLNYVVDGDPDLVNRNIQISNVSDDGPRVGVARDRGGPDSISGYALSLKIGCNDCSVNQYVTNRSDGFLDLLPSKQLKISNVTASYNSAFTNNLFPGIRFPLGPYTNITFEKFSIIDLANDPIQPPIGSAMQRSDSGIVFRGIEVQVNKWAHSGSPVPTILGRDNDVSIDFVIRESSVQIASAQNGLAAISLRASKANQESADGVQLTWSSTGTDSCSASGGWEGELKQSGSRFIAGHIGSNTEFDFLCNAAGKTVTARLKYMALR